MTQHDPFERLYLVTGEMEPIVFIGALLVSVYSLFKYFPIGRHKLWGVVPNPGLGLVRASLLLSVPWLVYIFITGAASDIQGFYIWFYVSFAYACLLVGSFSRPILDLWLLSDVVEKANLAAGIVLSGFVLGTAIAFGGALTGEGPGWIVVLVFFLLAYFELRANMALVSKISGRLSADVRLERDVSAAILLAGVAVGSGLISGRAAAGDFLGWSDALSDYFLRLIPMSVVPVVASLVGFITKSHPHRLLIRAATAGGLVAFGAYFYFLT